MQNVHVTENQENPSNKLFWEEYIKTRILKGEY